MPRQANVSIEYNFNQGLITEATGLNFPDNACTETYDCVFSETGPVSRRPPIDFEDSYTTVDIDRTNKAISSYVWEAVSEEGDFSLVVVQVGNTLYFYNTDEVSLSRGLISGSQVDLSSFYSSATNQDVQECTYAVGLGYLFVFHPGMNPIYVSYDATANTVTASASTLQIRDLAGVDDGKTVAERPTSQTNTHQYNLYNQGWNVNNTRFETVTFTNGSANIDWPNNNLSVGTPIYFTTDDTLPVNFAANTTYYVVTTATHVITVSSTQNGTAISAGSAGSGNHIGYTYNAYNTWANKRADFPSNADVWWDFKDDTGTFDINYVANYSRGTTPAPKGYYILDLFNQDRNTASGLAGISTVTYNERPSVGEFYSGRIWYSGIPNNDLNNKIYFSQIVENTAQLGRCYPKQDPTSQDLSVVLPTDGGFISVLEMGTVHYMKAMSNFLLLFTSNGIWGITGSEGVGFSPTDYSISPISDVGCVSYSNFIDTEDTVLWWNDEGIYALRRGQNGFEIRNITDDRIKTFYQQIPVVSKRQAKGSYNDRAGIITWLYRNTVAPDIDSVYAYDAVLKLNVKTSAFYPWTLPAATPKIHAVVAPKVTGQSSTIAFDVIDDAADNVIDGSGNQVVAFNFATYATSVQNIKYLTSYYTGSAYKFTWAQESPYSSQSVNNFLDWYEYDSTGVNYNSYFISGYKQRGAGQRNFQANYIYLFSDTEENLPIYDVSARCDYALVSSAGKWPNKQRVTFTNNDYKFQRRKLKVRGNGLTVQFMCESVAGEPMNVTGWSIFETINTGI